MSKGEWGSREPWSNICRISINDEDKAGEDDEDNGDEDDKVEI